MGVNFKDSAIKVATFCTVKGKYHINVDLFWSLSYGSFPGFYIFSVVPSPQVLHSYIFKSGVPISLKQMSLGDYEVTELKRLSFLALNMYRGII